MGRREEWLEALTACRLQAEGFVRVLLYEKVDLRVSLNFLKAYCVVIKDKA